HQRPRLLARHRPQGGQALAMTGEADRHHRARGHRGVQSRQLVHRAVEVGAVVPARAQHDLGVHRDAGLGEALHHGQELAAHPGLAEQGVAQVGIGGVHRDVQRREALRLDALELGLLQIGQGDVVAVQERETEVVVLDVEALAQSLRQLVDEAEDALVGAGRDLGRLRGLELEAERGAAPLEPRPVRPALPLHRELESLLAGVEVEVDDVAERSPVDGEDAVAGAQARPRGGGARRDRGHHHALRPRRFRGPSRHDQSGSPTEWCVSSSRRPIAMYCMPEVMVKPAVTQARSVVTNGGTSWKYTEAIAASTVTIWNTVDILPTQVGAGCTVPPATWITSTPMLSTTSRLTTTAVIQNGITLSQVRVTNPE